MKSFLIHARVVLTDGARLCVSTFLDITDDYFDFVGTGIVTNGISTIQDLLSLPIDSVESFSISLDDSDDVL